MHILRRNLINRCFATINFSKDYYKILGITKSASKADIRKAYLNLAKQYHPDSPTGNEEKFKDIGEAYEILGDEGTKSQYDVGKASGQQGTHYDNQYSDFWGRSNKGRTYQQYQNPYQNQYQNTGNSKQQRYTYNYEYYNPFTGKKTYYTYERSGNSRNQEQANQDFQKEWEEILKDFQKGSFRGGPFANPFTDFLRQGRQQYSNYRDPFNDYFGRRRSTIGDIFVRGFKIFGWILLLYLFTRIFYGRAYRQPPVDMYGNPIEYEDRYQYRPRQDPYYDPNRRF